MKVYAVRRIGTNILTANNGRAQVLSRKQDADGIVRYRNHNAKDTMYEVVEGEVEWKTIS